MREARILAQAKVNLRLRVLARETSGFHALETIFQRLELADEVRVRVGGGARALDCAGAECPPAGLGPVERNLAYRAAAVYADATGWPTGFAIEIDKRIPVGGGLGGGSADAGAVLRALDALAPAPLGAGLLDLAATLGADVPFLTLDSPLALAWGRGERLLPLRPLDVRTVILAAPTFGVSTADAYRWVSEARGAYVPEARVLPRDALDTWEGITAIATNDFEPVVGARHPEIARAVEVLRASGAAPALMSGSGSTVFGVFDDAPDVASLTATLAALAVRAVETRSVDRVARAEIGNG